MSDTAILSSNREVWRYLCLINKISYLTDIQLVWASEIHKFWASFFWVSYFSVKVNFSE